MGTTVIPSITTRKDMVRYIKQDYFSGSDGYQLLDASQAGNHLWCLVRHPKGYRFIVMFLLSGRKGEGWGYKAMDESTHPYYYTCPEHLLEQSEDASESGTRWRETCRQVRKEQAARKAWAKTLQWGDTLRYFRGYRLNQETGKQEEHYVDVVFKRPHSPTFFIGQFIGEAVVYRMRWEYLQLPDAVKEAP